MSRRSRSIDPASLETPERDAPPLQTPEGDGDDLQVRLYRARNLRENGQHWRSSWAAGRDAAVAAVEAGQSPKAIRSAPVPTAGIGCRACWAHGRDAALEAMKG